MKYISKIVKKTLFEYKDGKEIGYKWKMFSENEHTFEKYKRYKYIYNFGEPKYSDWVRDGVSTYHYD